MSMDLQVGDSRGNAICEQSFVHSDVVKWQVVVQCKGEPKDRVSALWRDF